MKQCLRRASLILAAVTITSGGVAFGFQEYSWDRVPAAEWYSAVIRENGALRQIRVPENQILLPTGVKIETLWGHTPQGKVRVFPKASNPPPTREQAPSPGQEAAPTSSVETVTRDEAVPDEEAASPVVGTGDFLLTLGSGSENLQAKGGASEFTGGSRIGTLGFEVTVNNGGDWYGFAHINTHKFTPRVEEADGSTPTESQTLSLTRASVAGGAWYDGRRIVGWKGSSRLLLLGVGVGLVRQPALQVKDTDTSAAGPTDLTGVGPLFAAQCGWELFQNHTIGGTASLIPHLFGSMNSGISLNSSLWWKINFGWNLYSRLAFAFDRDSAELSAGCPEGNVCRKTSSGVIQGSQVVLGLGLQL